MNSDPEQGRNNPGEVPVSDDNYAKRPARRTTLTALTRNASCMRGLLLGSLALFASSCQNDRKSVVGPTQSSKPSLSETSQAPAGPAPLLLLTDKSDYSPGETVTITGHGWKPGSTVALVLEEDLGIDGPWTYSAVVDDNGDFTNREFVTDEHDVGVLFKLTVTGDGEGGQAFFTDDQPSNPPGCAVHGAGNCTTLSATKTASGHMRRTFHWTIDKSVSPASWDLFSGDDGTSQYGIAVTKDGGTDEFLVSGQICVTNGGSANTENLQIVDQVEFKTGSGQFGDLSGASQTITPSSQLAPGESACYPYQIVFSPISGAIYRNTAHITITDHAGHDGTAFGPDPKADFTLPSSPDILVHNAIHVDDTNSPAGAPFAFTADGSTSYGKKLTCDDDKGEHGNTASITYDDDQTAG